MVIWLSCQIFHLSSHWHSRPNLKNSTIPFDILRKNAISHTGWVDCGRRERETEGFAFPFLHKYTQNGLFSYIQGFSSIEYIFSIRLDRRCSPIHLANKEEGSFGVAEIWRCSMGRVHNSEHDERSIFSPNINHCVNMVRLYENQFSIYVFRVEEL